MMAMFMAALALLIASSSALSDPPADLSISEVRAYFYFHEIAQFGTEDLLAGKSALYNSMIGGGAATSPTSTVLVSITVVGALPPKRRQVLEFVARTSSGEEVVRKEVDLRTYFTAGSKVVVPFLVHGVGCERLDLTARLVGRPREAEVAKALPLRCGE